MSTSQYLLGTAELALIAAALGLGAYYVRALLVPAWTGALARLAEVVLGLSALVVIAELLGLFKALEEVPLVIACVIVGLAGAQWARSRGIHHEAEAPDVRPSRAMIVVAIIAAAVVVTHWAQPTEQSLDRGMYFQDSTWYHMSFSARFAETGEVGPLHFTDPLKLAAWFYPQNNELLHGVGIVALDIGFPLASDQPDLAGAVPAGRLVHRAAIRRRRGDADRRGRRARLRDAGHDPGRQRAKRHRGPLLPVGGDRVPGQWRRNRASGARGRERAADRGRRR